MNWIITTLISTLLAMNTCKEVKLGTATPDEILTRVWIQEGHQSGITTYSLEDTLLINKPGIAFRSDGTLTKSQNAGWCGTPPITYSNFEGTWEYETDSTIELSYAYWGGTVEETWKIVSLTETSLEIKSLDYKMIRQEER